MSSDWALLPELLGLVAEILSEPPFDFRAAVNLVLFTSKALTEYFRASNLLQLGWLFSARQRTARVLAFAARTCLTEVTTPTPWQRNVLDWFINMNTSPEQQQQECVHFKRYRRDGWTILMAAMVNAIRKHLPRQKLVVCVVNGQCARFIRRELIRDQDVRIVHRTGPKSQNIEVTDNIIFSDFVALGWLRSLLPRAFNHDKCYLFRDTWPTYLGSSAIVFRYRNQKDEPLQVYYGTEEGIY